MFGTYDSESSAGIFHHSLKTLFQRINTSRNVPDDGISTSETTEDTKTSVIKETTTVFASFFEVYANENIYDLISQESVRKPLPVREDMTRGAYAEGLKEVAVMSVADAETVLALGLSNRHVAETDMNQCSSRSHAVFSLKLKTKLTHNTGQEAVHTSKFTLMDLAGSERQKSARTGKGRLKEASSINSSLLSLANVVHALAGKESGIDRHVPFRDSKLTFLLRDSFEGKSKVCLVATVSPSLKFMTETIYTLKFAQRAKVIKNHAHKMSPKSDTIDEDNSCDTVDKLRAQARCQNTKDENKKSYWNKHLMKSSI